MELWDAHDKDAAVAYASSIGCLQSTAKRQLCSCAVIVFVAVFVFTKATPSFRLISFVLLAKFMYRPTG